MGFSILSWRKKELLFVVVILVIGFGISATQVWLGQIKTRDAQRKADTELISRALQVYYQEHDVFPIERNGKIVACGNEANDECEWGRGEVKDSDGVVYLKNLPADPFTYKGWKYVYETYENLQGIRIYAAVENKRDSDLKNNLTTMCGEYVQCNWYVEN